MSTDQNTRLALLPIEPAMVRVLAGPFLMGTSDEQVQAMASRFDWAKWRQEKQWFSREQPQHSVTLPAFAIGRYPVTNAEFRPFLDDGGYQKPDYWTDAGWQWKENGGWEQPRYWDDPRFYSPSQPVAGVSWYEAVAYCHWLAATTNKPYRLPTEAEWEKAARGTDGRLWPWGDEPPDEHRCNLGFQVGKTTPVGQYSPQGDSPYGCADMAGNVWEWSGSLYENYVYQASAKREDPHPTGCRVLRGGSWGSSQSGARCACRDYLPPHFRVDLVGLRVVVAAK